MMEIELQNEIASGGMGSVWRGLLNGELVAIKFPSDQYEKDQLKRDGRFLSSLSHENIVDVKLVAHDEQENLFIAMEFLDGGTLETRIEEYREPDKAIDIIERLAFGLEFLHQNGVIHRDLKPSNVVFDSKGCPKIVDFGLIKRTSDESRFSSAATKVGTAFYSPPEMRGLFPDKKLDYVADVYSLGVILYELITGTSQPPINDCRPGRVNRMVNGSLDQICLGCLQEDPDRRYDIPKLLEAIKRYRQGLYPVAMRYPREYPKVQLGDNEINVVRVLGGDGQTKYQYPDGIKVRLVDDRLKVPDEVHEVTEDWLKQKVDFNKAKGTPFENRDQPRITNIGSGFTDESTENLYPLVLNIGTSNYFETQITNASIDVFLPDRSTIREKHAGSVDEFSESKLANPLAVNLSVITRDNFIFVSQRGKNVGVNVVLDPEDKNRVPAVSGTGSPRVDVDEYGVFCPFESGRREAEEEVFTPNTIDLEDIIFFGIARTTGYFFPFLFGEVRTDLSAAEFKSQPSKHVNDVVGRWGRPFTIDSVTEWILELLQLSGLSHTAIFSLYQSLIYEHPDKINEINRRLCNRK